MNDIIWIGLHLIIAVISLDKRLLNSSAPWLLIFVILFYFFVPFGGDRENYYIYFDNLDAHIYTFEPGFYLISQAISKVYPSKYFIYFVFNAIILTSLFFTFKYLEGTLLERRKLRNTTIILIIMISVFFFLGSQNVLRQGLSLSILSLAISFYFKGWKKFAVFISFISMTIHSATPIFAVSFFFFLFCLRLNSKFRYILVFTFTAGSYIFITSYLHGSAYIESTHEWAGDRVSSELKVLVIWLSVLSTNVLLRKDSRYRDIVWLRTSFLIFITPFSLNGEIFARLAVGIYLIDIYILLSALSDTGKNRQFASVVLILSSGFAPNVLGLIL